MNIVLAGNPNAGKTTLFNSLTRSRLKTGNWHGVTTRSFSKKSGNITFTDSPGLYSFEAYTMEEGSAADSIASADAVINVVDCMTLENSLALTKKLISANKNVVVYLTKKRALRARGGWVNVGELEKFLGVPVYDCRPSELKRRARRGELLRPAARGESSLDKAYYAGNARLRPIEKLFYGKICAPVIFFGAMLITFFFTFFPGMPGAVLKDAAEELICVKFAEVLRSGMTNAYFASFFCDGVVGGAGGVLSFAPQLAMLYLSLILLDESGVMSALCFVTDGLFEKVNLSGRAAFSLISGLGCTAAAISTTRGYANRASQVRTIAMLPYIPCGAKLPVFITFLSPLFQDPFPAVCILYFTGIAISLASSVVMRGGEEGLITEIAPVSLPSPSQVAKKLCFYLSSFIIKVASVVTVFCMVSWLLSHLSPSFALVGVEDSILARLCSLLLPLFRPMGVDDWRLAYAFVSGFAAKENVAATISLMFGGGLQLTLPSAAAACAFVLTCPACISAFSASVREIGFKKTLAINLFQLLCALLFSYAVYFIFNLL